MALGLVGLDTGKSRHPAYAVAVLEGAVVVPVVVVVVVVAVVGVVVVPAVVVAVVVWCRCRWGGVLLTSLAVVMGVVVEGPAVVLEREKR